MANVMSDSQALCQILLQLEDAIGEAFLAAHRAVERADRDQVYGGTRANRN